MVAAVINLFAIRTDYAEFFGRPTTPRTTWTNGRAHRRSRIERRIYAICTMQTSHRLLHDARRADPACGLREYGGLALEPEHRAVVTADTQLPKRIDKFLVRKPGISGRGLI